jgi:hypothetical protein
MSHIRLSLNYRFALTVGLISAALLVSSYQILAQTGAQDSNVEKRLELTATVDGFTGTYTWGGEKYSIENQVKEKSFRTRITRPDGRLLIGSSKESDVILVSLPTGELRLNSAKPSPFSTVETKAIEDFVKSDEAIVVRRILYEVIKKRGAEKPSLLGGFRVMAMLLGDDEPR